MTVETFWARVDRRGPDDCWPWLGTTQSNGYGVFAEGQVRTYAHRRSLEIALGRPLGLGMLACHFCDNPPCVNPRHLYEGTFADNIVDAVKRGRRHQLRSWPCPDCGASITRLTTRASGRCEACVKVAIVASRARKFVAWRRTHPLKDPDWRSRRRTGACQRVSA